MTEFDHEGPDLISEYRNSCSIGSPVDGIKDVVGPMVALLQVRSVLSEFVRERSFFVACDVPCDRTR
jgi:molybdopterin-guanine dinucleotide biosynthesis protein A